MDYETCGLGEGLGKSCASMRRTRDKPFPLLQALCLPAQPRPETPAFGFRALVGQKGGQLPVHVPALLFRLVQPPPQVGNGIGRLAALSVAVYVQRSAPFTHLFNFGT